MGQLTMRKAKECGTRAGYSAGCRCGACRKAWAAYMREYKRSRGIGGRRRAPVYDGSVVAVTCRLTDVAKRMLDVEVARQGAKPGEVVEQLLREHATGLAST